MTFPTPNSLVLLPRASIGFGFWVSGKPDPQAGKSPSVTPNGRSEYRQLLPDFQESDVCGSCFAIQDYTAHVDFGGDAALSRLRDRVHSHGMRLLLDFVPNHTAPDHPWVQQHPEFYIHGNEDLLAREPQNYARVPTPNGSIVLAFGRDPYFAGWPDTFQLNYAEPRSSGRAGARLGEDRHSLRRRSLRHGDACSPGCFRADMGPTSRAFLVAGDSTHKGEEARLPLYGRGLLGPRMDSAATGI